MASRLELFPRPRYSAIPTVIPYSQKSFLPSSASARSSRLVSVACADDRTHPWRGESSVLVTSTRLPRRNAMTFIFSSLIFSEVNLRGITLAQPPVVFREYVDTFDGYTLNYPKNWIQVRGAGADVFFRDPFVLDENLSVEMSSPSSSRYKSVEDLGPPQAAGEKVLKQYLTEFMSTRLGVRRESNILSTSSRVADDGRLYYDIEVNIKSYANNNELAVMPQDRVVRLEWDRRYLSVLGVENNRLYELRLQTPENVFQEEENDLRRVMDSFRVMKLVEDIELCKMPNPFSLQLLIKQLDEDPPLLGWVERPGWTGLS
ncbi:hypothetical protein H6P81_002251 [Aristolochia fimbriata]|uniref:PsbP C-terminal domain-containing protein n=1 Tax=Aristolochia fimbriata TaxID=158543 RepID=A0AAV7FDU6_ARIFI|nr:hypothetical protein H6P81_002251 [Aristolochia fimbriata]